MTTYVHVWPVVDPDRGADLLAVEACDDLADLLDACLAVPCGAPVWAYDGGLLAVRVPVLPEHARAGDMRPWESREALIGDLFDWRAA